MHAVFARFRRGVVGGDRDMFARRVAAAEVRGDAEIDQMRASVGADQHIRRLDVAMDDALRMRVAQRFADLDQQIHAFAHAGVAAVAPGVHGDAIDVAHGEPRVAVGVDATIEQGGDAGMFQPRQMIALADEGLQQGRRGQGGAHALERGALFVLAVGAMRGVDRAHAAFGDHAVDLPRAQARADARIVGFQRRRLGRAHLRQQLGGRDVEQACLTVGGEQRQQRGEQLRIALLQVGAHARPRRLGQVEVVVEHR
ncbi:MULTISPECIES: hypothetical protein [unclassified Lysobacter]|uniref:hypothetical protein n=1 Tax=unclassified Lysobacter TaxID=2635362 RepID=UPI002035714E|nr:MULTISPECIES: hypothetical protein [unclassified Lysobacter]